MVAGAGVYSWLDDDAAVLNGDQVWGLAMTFLRDDYTATSRCSGNESFVSSEAGQAKNRYALSVVYRGDGVWVVSNDFCTMLLGDKTGPVLLP